MVDKDIYRIKMFLVNYEERHILKEKKITTQMIRKTPSPSNEECGMNFSGPA